MDNQSIDPFAPKSVESNGTVLNNAAVWYQYEINNIISRVVRERCSSLPALCFPSVGELRTLGVRAVTPSNEEH
jgi:hypothetical protein